MENSDIMKVVTNIIHTVFKNDSIEVTEELEASQVPEWDSLAHIDLVMRVESEFGLKFPLGELQDIKNVGDLVNLIEEKKRA